MVARNKKVKYVIRFGQVPAIVNIGSMVSLRSRYRAFKMIESPACQHFVVMLLIYAMGRRLRH
jgi:hypothetical protein